MKQRERGERCEAKVPRTELCSESEPRMPETERVRMSEEGGVVRQARSRQDWPGDGTAGTAGEVVRARRRERQSLPESLSFPAHSSPPACFPEFAGRHPPSPHPSSSSRSLSFAHSCNKGEEHGRPRRREAEAAMQQRAPVVKQ